MHREYQANMRWKINAFAVLIIFIFSVLFLRIFYIQTIKSFSYRNFLKKQILKPEEVRHLRGNIYDRNGEILAFSSLKYSYFCFPKQIKNTIEAANFTEEFLGFDRNEFLKDLQKHRGFFWLKRKFDSNKMAEKLPTGIARIKEEKRFYPSNEILCHTLGYTGLDNRGLSGIEFSKEKILEGSVIKIYNERDAKGRDIGQEKILEIENYKAENIYLTIDSNLQLYIEKNLDRIMEKSKALTVTIIVQDIKSGEILAMGNAPRFNPNQTQKNISSLSNNAISKVFEPGSTLKVMVVGAALNENVVTLKTKIDCENGKFKIYNHTIKDHGQKYNKITVEDVLVNSSNIGMAKIGEMLGKEKLYYYLKKFGFNCYTGIELPGEAKGLLKDTKNWSGLSQYIIPFGQGLGVTCLQIISAYSSIANNGNMLEPRIIKAIEQDGKMIEQKPRFVRQILPENICKDLLKSMEAVVTRGSGQFVKMRGYRVGGKTGTAQQIDPRTRKYSNTDYIASLAGVFPIDNPRFSILVVVDSPRGGYWGGEVCGPAFKDIVEFLAFYYKIPCEKKVL